MLKRIVLGLVITGAIGLVSLAPSVADAHCGRHHGYRRVYRAYYPPPVYSYRAYYPATYWGYGGGIGYYGAYYGGYGGRYCW